MFLNQNIQITQYLFTSQSLSQPHPHKLPHQLSHPIFHPLFPQHPKPPLAPQTLLNTPFSLFPREITTTPHLDYIKVPRQTIKPIRYNSSHRAFHAN
ncbi:S-adenosylmethionine synthetase N-terminal domain-containing protein, partial [Neisseria sicca]|uniref:S-adenosylmethionine synthetase N-terminal domain-containing protein n=1 Tax=Neisseria sicca TaxID=490 RepID=UPI0034D9879B